MLYAQLTLEELIWLINNGPSPLEAAHCSEGQLMYLKDFGNLSARLFWRSAFDKLDMRSEAIWISSLLELTCEVDEVPAKLKEYIKCSMDA